MNDFSELELRPVFLRKLIEQGTPASPISGQESQLLEQRDSLRIIDGLIPSGLVQFVNKLSPYVQPLHVVLFLLDSLDVDETELKEAVSGLENAAQEGLHLSANDLMEVFRESSNGMPPSLMVSMLGTVVEDKPDVQPCLSSGLNLDAMRDFR